VSFLITGMAGRGEETPRFDATLRSVNGDARTDVARIQSDGQGGSARMYWLVDSTEVRESARAWLESEARRLAPADLTASPYWRSPSEAALLVVPAHIIDRKRPRSRRKGG
jgi:hypothetical protein